MLSFVEKYGHNVHSQNGEDGIIQECIKRLGIVSGVCVEIGGNDGLWLSNTRLLIEQGWNGTFVEADFNLHQKCKENWKDNPNVKSVCSRVSGENVNAFVKDDCDLLSTDTDGPDYRIFTGLKVRPKIVIVEIDSSIPPVEFEFNSDGGAGYRPMVELGVKKDYFLLCHTGNLIFVGREYWHLFPEVRHDPIRNFGLYFNRAWLKEAA